MTTITLTPEPQTASVDVLVTGLPASPTTVTILRTGVDGRPTPLRGSPFTVSSGTVVAVDSEAPFGVPITYEVDGVTAVTSLDGITVPWLTHPLAPFLSVPVTVDDDTEWTFPGRTYVFDVIGRAEPVYTWYRRATRSGVLRLAYATLGERSSIRSALETGAPMLIRYPAGYPQFPSAYVGLGDARIIPRGVGSHQGVVEMDYRVVAAPPSSVAAPSAAWQWDDVPVSFASWDALVAALPSWSSVVVYNPATPNPAPTPYPGPTPAPPPWGS